MALSNWDTFAMDLHGCPVHGSFTSTQGVTVEVYKNGLYVNDPETWKEGTFSKPVVASIEEGSLRYRDVYIWAIRGPQDGIYACIWERNYNPNQTNGIIAIGVYGYDGENWTGIERSSTAWFTGQLKAVPSGVDLPEEFNRLCLDHGFRYNQGDAYFATHIGKNIPATLPGEAEEPVIDDVLKAIFPPDQGTNT